MKLPDLDLLLYALDTTSARHAEACEWVEDTLSGTETVALTRVTMLAFLRLSTRAAVFTDSISPKEALADAHLAALAIEHGAELCSCDTDFSRFTGLR